MRCLITFLMLAFLTACTPPPKFYHYKMTVEIETPQGVVTNSVVRQLEYYYSRELLSQWGGSFDLSGNFRERGDALFVDLPNGKTVFFLTDVNYGKAFQFHGKTGWLTQRVSGPRGTQEALDTIDKTRERFVFPTRQQILDGWDGKLKYENSQGELVERSQSSLEWIAKTIYPRMVYFQDINVPETVTELDPENLTAVFGEGYRLKSLTVQMTDDKMTDDVGKKLRWLDEYSSRQLNGDRYHHGQKAGLAAHISGGSLSTEIKR